MEIEEKNGGAGGMESGVKDGVGVCVEDEDAGIALIWGIVDPEAGGREDAVEGLGVSGGVKALERVLVVPVSIEVKGRSGGRASSVCVGAGVKRPERGCGATYTMISSSSSIWELLIMMSG